MAEAQVTRASVFELVLKRDRTIVIAALAVVSVLAWVYTLAGVGLSMNALEMTTMADMGTVLATPTPWSRHYALVVYAMWLIMMIAMMLPSAAPMVLLFAAIARNRDQRSTSHGGIAAFVAGYLAIWAFFSACAALVHWGLEMSGLLTPMMTPTSALLGGTLLVAAGLYQLTPFKQACLRSCRNPIAFITQHWRAGTGGAFLMGGVHGAFCLGCCWVLMLLLFFGGVMNLYWIAGIATYVLAEKVIPQGRWLSYAAGALLVIAGVSTLAKAM
jgi:predicted metal-binding membrane protein